MWGIVLEKAMSSSTDHTRTYGEILSELVQNGAAGDILDAEMNVEQRKVVSINGTLYINPTDVGRRIVGFEAGDDVEVATTADEIRIRRVPGEEDGEGGA